MVSNCVLIGKYNCRIANGYRILLVSYSIFGNIDDVMVGVWTQQRVFFCFKSKYQSKSEITLWNSAKARISLRKKTPITTILLPRDELWYEEKPGNAKLRWKREAVCPTAGGSRISSNRTFAALFPYIYNRSTKEECQMRKRKLKIFLTPTENSIVIQSLNHLRNALLRENRDTGCLDELLLKVMCAPVKKM